jgi:amino acid transporter
VGNFQQIIAYFIFSAVVFLGLAVAGLFVFRRRRHELGFVILTPGYPATPLAFITLVVVLLCLVALRSPRETLLGIADFLRQVVEFSNTIHFSEGHLSRRHKEMLASYVSYLNRCPY